MNTHTKQLITGAMGLPAITCSAGTKFPEFRVCLVHIREAAFGADYLCLKLYHLHVFCNRPKDALIYRFTLHMIREDPYWENSVFVEDEDSEYVCFELSSIRTQLIITQEVRKILCL